MSVYTLPLFFDAHVHLRQNDLMHVVRYTAKYCQFCLAMPNTNPPLLTAQQCLDYKEKIAEVLRVLHRDGNYIQPKFQPLVAIYVNEDTTPEMIYEAADAGIIAGKLYPRGRTTGSDYGIVHYSKCRAALQAMEERDMVCCLHGEHPVPPMSCTVMDWERQFVMKIFPEILQQFPKLRVVLEHITDELSVMAVAAAAETRGRVAATITAHHLHQTLDDVLANGIRPHNYCKPVAKKPRDLMSLKEAARSGNKCFFLGSDSAPHNTKKKETACGCAGCFTAGYLPSHIVEVFDPEASGDGSLYDNLCNFVAYSGLDFYELQGCGEMFRLHRMDAKIQEHSIHMGWNECVKHWRAGETVRWVQRILSR